MKTVLTLVSIVMAANFAQASGFECVAENSPIKVKVYEHTQPELGTRTGAMMVVSDSSIGHGNKTIARFTDAEGNLKSKSLTYKSNVDLRFNNSSRAGELIAGTKLGQLKTITLDVFFSYDSPVAAGDEVGAMLYLTKRNGDVISETMICTRYLKH